MASGLEPVPRYEPSTFHPINRWRSHCAIGASGHILVKRPILLGLPEQTAMFLVLPVPGVTWTDCHVPGRTCARGYLNRLPCSWSYLWLQESFSLCLFVISESKFFITCTCQSLVIYEMNRAECCTTFNMANSG